MSKKDPLTKEPAPELINAWWRASNYLAACQLYLLDNPLLREPLKPEHLKRTIVGHWGHLPWAELYLYPPQPSHQQI